MTANFKESILPVDSDKLTISSQTGMNNSRVLDNSFAGMGSTGEHFIPKVVMIFRSSSSLAGSNTLMIAGVDGSSIALSDWVKDSLIFSILSLKYDWKLDASATSDQAVGKADSLLAPIS